MLEPVWTCGPGGVRAPVGEQAPPRPSTLRAWVSSHGHRSVPSQAGPAWPPAFRAFTMVRAKVKYARNSDFLLW